MFAIFFSHAVYHWNTDGYLGEVTVSPFESRRPRRDGRDGYRYERKQAYAYETPALAEYFAARRAANADYEEEHFVVDCRTGRKLSELQPRASAPGDICYGYAPVSDADAPF